MLGSLAVGRLGFARARLLPTAAVVAGAIWLTLIAMPVRADGGPHNASDTSGASGLTSGSCTGCHRAHRAQGPSITDAPSEVALCLNCHGSASTGATTNVSDGIDSGTGRGLKGGGFSHALMDTAWTGTAVSSETTSSHLLDGTAATIWGNGVTGSGAGKAGVILSCVSCHNPHGNGNYRSLRPIPIDSDAGSGILVADETTKVYTVSSAQNRYFGEVYGGGDYIEQYALDEWCVRCHTRYEGLEAGSGSSDSGDPIFAYRHVTRWPYTWVNCGTCHEGGYGQAADNLGVGWQTAHEPVCQNCHVAHGSSARMTAGSGSAEWPDGATAPYGNERSSLLRLDNRGVCQGCHDPTQ